MKKIIALLMTLIMILPLVGCGGGDKSGEIKVTFMAKHSYTKDIEDLSIIADIEKKFFEKTGKTINWNIIGVGDEEVKGIQLTTAKKRPDVFVGMSYNDAKVMSEKDLFLDLTDYITEEKMPNVLTMFKDYPQLWKESELHNGRIYGLPQVMPFASENTSFFMVNKAWIAAINSAFSDANLKDPTPVDGVYPVITLNDFNAWVRAFKNPKYASAIATVTAVSQGKIIALDMNGEGDLYNYLTAFGDSTFGTKGVDDGLWGNTDNLFVREDSSKNRTVQYKYTTDEMRYMSNYFSRLYRDKILNQEFVTQSFEVMMGNGKDPTGSKIGFSTGWSRYDRFGPYADQYVEVMPLSGTSGVNGNKKPLISNSGYGLQFGFNRALVMSESKKIDDVIELLNIIYDPLVSMKLFYGDGADSFHEYTGTQTNAKGEVYKYEFTVPDGEFYDVWKWKNGFADNGLGYVSKSLEEQTLMVSEHQQRIDVSKKLYGQYVVPEGDYIPLNMKFNEEDQEYLDKTFTDLQTLGKTNITKYVTSNKSDITDSQWTEFQTSLRKRGIVKLQEIYTNRYLEYIKK